MDGKKNDDQYFEEDIDMAEDTGTKGGEASDNGEDPKTTSGEGRGFASMDPDQQKKIASKGGKASHKSGNAHEWDSEEAREAGRKGGQS